VRALTHTVLLTVDSLRWQSYVPPAYSTSSAIRHRCGDTLTDVEASGVVPDVGSTFRRPPSLRRVVVENRSPGFTGTIQTLRLPVIPPAAASFSFAMDGTTVASGLRSHARADAPTQGRGVGGGGHPCAANDPWRWQDLPSSRRNPCRHAQVPSTPEEPHATRLNAAGDAATAKGTAVTSSMDLSRLNRLAHRLAVYASQGAVARAPRKTRFRLLAKLCRAEFAPAGFYREVSVMFQLHITSSSRELAWRNPL